MGRCRPDRIGVALLVVVAAPVLWADSPTAQGIEFFETRIRPVLVANCYVCHSADAKTRMGGLSLDTKEGIREGGQRGHAVVPGDTEASLAIQALRYEGGLKMPPGGRLPEAVVQDFEQWIRMGAPDPREAQVLVAASGIDIDEGRRFWAFQIPARRAAPMVDDVAWPRGTIDQFVLADLESRGLRPAPDAEEADLLRRVTFDLTGLPPSADELAAFLADDRDDAYSRVVDRLLESDRFGERWGRHWLDVVRYADTIGRTRNLPFPVAWKYRDYVIRSFNQDKPFDRFVHEQIAGDLLPFEGAAERLENQLATGFLAIGAHDLNEPDAKQFDMDVADEMINTFTRSFLALSVGCARCHDHKFDPIRTKDYYALAGIFRGTELRSGLRRRPRFNAGYFRTMKLVELDGVPEFPSLDGYELRAERERLWSELQAAEEARDRQKCREFSRALGKLPMPQNLAMGVVEAKRQVAMRVNIGGDPHTLGEPVLRGFVKVLSPAGTTKPEIGPNESGRLQLAEWLTRRSNPLSARVMANRIWHHLLGKGIVPTVDNFGAMGRRPVNQPLLDYLAVQFMDQDWSMKSLIREIALSRTYRLSTADVEANLESDPDNNHFWRANVRRLEAESVRDAILFVSGELETGPPPPSPIHGFDRNQQLNPNSRTVKSWESEERYRSVYVPVIRNLPNRLFDAFDFPEPSETHGARDVTTAPGQALFMMNNDFVRKNAAVTAERLLADQTDDHGRVQLAFRRVLSRDPSKAESDRALEWIRDIGGSLGAENEGPRDGDTARAWLSGLVAAALDREPGKDEMEAALEYVKTHVSGADSSREAMVEAFRNDEGRFRGRIVVRVVGSAIGRTLGPREQNKALRNIRAWHLNLKGTASTKNRTVLARAAIREQGAWTNFVHALYNSAEFRYRN